MADPLERLTNLLVLLLETRLPLTLDQIASELTGQYPSGEAARRSAFERDKAILRGEGIPLEVSATADGGSAYRIDRARFELPDLGLTDEERRALQLAAATVQIGADAGGAGGPGDWADRALAKLGTGGPGGPGDVSPVAALPASDALPALFEANASRATIRFRYRGRERRLDPYALFARRGAWYVLGHDHDAAQDRTYRVDRFESAPEVGPPDAFEVPEGFDARARFPEDPLRMGGGALVQARVAIDAAHAPAVETELGAGVVAERRPDGAIVVAVDVTNREAFRSWVLGLLEHAVVLGPPELRDDVVAWLSQFARGAG